MSARPWQSDVERTAKAQAAATMRWWPAARRLIADLVPSTTPRVRAMIQTSLDGGLPDPGVFLPIDVAEHLRVPVLRMLPLVAACEVLRRSAMSQQGAAHVALGEAMTPCGIALLRRLEAPQDVRDELVGRALEGLLRGVEGRVGDPVRGLDDHLRTLEDGARIAYALPAVGAARLAGIDGEASDAFGEAALQVGVLTRLTEDHQEADGGAFLRAARAQGLDDEAGWEALRDELSRRMASARSMVELTREPRLTARIVAWTDAVRRVVDEALSKRVTSDEQFCIRLLPQVSRTFALSIEMLPVSLRESVRVGYLLCRVLDTIEDDESLAHPVREALFDAFDAALERPDRAGALEELAVAHDVGEEAEAVLIRAASAVFRRYEALSPEQRGAMDGPIREMSHGMRIATGRIAREGRLRMRDVADLEQYCYYVAGTVGELLTGLFLQVCPVEGDARRQVLDHAVPFGLALQLVNIVKDCAEDQTRGVCFVPEEVVQAHGLEVPQLLEADHRDAALAAIGDVVAVARKHLEGAVAYSGAWPADGRAGSDIRLFCLVPLVLAIETLTVVMAGADTLVHGRTPKVTRETVHRVVAACADASRDDGAWRSMLESYGFDLA